jgi:hypothetical protein
MGPRAPGDNPPPLSPHNHASPAEDDGLAYFQPQPIPMAVDVNLSLALINLTMAAIAQTPNATGVQLVGLSSSGFDVKQEGNGGSTYGWYERTILAAPGVIQSLTAVTFHPYQVRATAARAWQPCAARHRVSARTPVSRQAAGLAHTICRP